MRLSVLLFFYFFFVALNACQEKRIESNAIEKNKTQSGLPEKKVETEPELFDEKPLDSINKKNAVVFLEKYGALNRENQVLIKTRFGNIQISLHDDTPLHRSSFVFLTKMGYFDTTCFYRVVPDFIIQGGESERLDTQRYKARYHRYRIPPEFRENRKHQYGAVAMARDWENNPRKYSTAFEFYIVQNRKGAHHLNNEHTVIGQVVSGFDVVDKIVSLEAGSDEWPLEDVFMKVEIIR